MSRMFHDKDGKSRRLDGGESGHNRRRLVPPRDKTLCFRQTLENFNWMEEAMLRAGYRGRADFIADALGALRGLTGDAPLPSHLKSGKFNNSNDNYG